MKYGVRYFIQWYMHKIPDPQSFKIVKNYHKDEAPDYNLEAIYFKLVQKYFKRAARNYNFEVIYNKHEAKNCKVVQESWYSQKESISGNHEPSRISP